MNGYLTAGWRAGVPIFFQIPIALSLSNLDQPVVGILIPPWGVHLRFTRFLQILLCRILTKQTPFVISIISFKDDRRAT